MTLNAFYEAIYDMIYLILNTKLSKNITIIQENQNIQRPTGNYIIIGNPVNRRKVGQSFKNGETNSSGITQIISSYEILLSIREVRGDGELLQILLDYMEAHYVLNFLKSKYISFLRAENIQPIPDITEGKIENRAVVNMYFTYCNEILIDTSYIADVELENNI